MGEYREDEVLLFSEANNERIRIRGTQGEVKNIVTTFKKNILHSSQQGQKNIGTGAQRGCGIPILRYTQAELWLWTVHPMVSFEAYPFVILCFSEELCWPHLWERPSIIVYTCNLCWRWSLWRIPQIVVLLLNRCHAKETFLDLFNFMFLVSLWKSTLWAKYREKTFIILGYRTLF